jgi:hypothetical protein
VLCTLVRVLINPSPANEILDDNAASSAMIVFETDDDHAVPLETATPAVEAIFSGDAA